MKIKGLMVDPITNMPILILKQEDGDAILPIWVGIFEANAIALRMEQIDTPRPMTHDLLQSMLDRLEATVNHIVVNDLHDNTFYALINISVDGQEIEIDSRPSDAIALALRTDSTIFVEDKVLKEAKSADLGLENLKGERLKQWLKDLDPKDLGKYEM